MDGKKPYVTRAKIEDSMDAKIRYQVVYFTKNLTPTKEVTDIFAIYIRSDDGLTMRCYYEHVRSGACFRKTNWFKYSDSFSELVDISEQDAFILCL